MTRDAQLPTERTTAAYAPEAATGSVRATRSTQATLVDAKPPEADTPLLDDRERYLERVDHRATAARMRLLVPAAAVGWVAFFGLDVIVALWVYPTDLLPFVLIRLAGLAVLVAAGVVLHRVKDPSPGLLTLLDVSMIVSTAGCLAIMGLFAGGVSSPYHALVVLVMLGRAAVIPQRWQEGLWRLSLPLLADASVIAIASLAAPRIGAQWLEPAARGSSVFFSTLLIGAWVLVVIGNHYAWALRRQVFASRSLGRYKLRKRIGKGGMGEVWVARDEELRRDVALKVVRPTDGDPEAVVRFEREIRATAALQHPNTIRVFNHGVSDDGLWYYAMELLEGETLQQLVHRSGPLPPQRAARLLRQAARALAEAHEHGIVHRDVKPENLFVTNLGGEPDVMKVLDFGIARMVEDEANLTSTGFVTGTPAYMAPEVATGGSATASSDIYGLGSTLYFALTGVPPFEGTDAGAVMRQHVHAPAPNVRERSPHPVPPHLEGVVIRALSKDPAHRFPDAAGMAAALEHA